MHIHVYTFTFIEHLPATLVTMRNPRPLANVYTAITGHMPTWLMFIWRAGRLSIHGAKYCLVPASEYLYLSMKYLASYHSACKSCTHISATVLCMYTQYVFLSYFWNTINSAMSFVSQYPLTLLNADSETVRGHETDKQLQWHLIIIWAE